MNQKTDVQEFIQNCLHCIISRTRRRAPGPLVTTLLGQRPNEVVRTGFRYMGDAEGSEPKYLLVIKDNLSVYTWLIPYTIPGSNATIDGLAEWIASFGRIVWIVADEGTHFTAAVVQGLIKVAGINQSVIAAYCPWRNGAVQKLCRRCYE